MPEKYDAIVIGAGLGGLSAAARLAKAGMGVLVLERHNVPGGYATSFVRGRFEFEASLHELSGIGFGGEKTALSAYLDQLGVSDRVEFLQIKDLYRSIFPGLDISLPMGREAYETTICDAFPHEADGIRRFLDKLFALDRDVKRLEADMDIGQVFSPFKALTIPFKYPNSFRYLPETWGPVLNGCVRDEKARAVLSQYWGYFGLPPSEQAFLYFAVGLVTYIRFGAAYPKGRSQALSAAFADVIESCGGRIELGAGVEKVLTEGGRVTGVKTSFGERFDGDWIVSNADPLITCRDLIGEDAVPGRFFKSLRPARLGASSTNIYLGLNAPPEALGFTEHEIFINESYDLESHHRSLHRCEDPEVVVMTCYNNVWPEISPPGTSMAVITCLQMGKPWFELKPDEYYDTKMRTGESMLRMAERVSPGLRDSVEEIEISTPVTNQRFAGHTAGCIYGFDQPAHYNTVLRMPPKGPLDRLYFAGAWTQPGGGYEPVIMSGKTAAELILGRAAKGAA